MQELRDLEGFLEARRGAGFSRELDGADFKRPLGIFSILPELQRDLRLGCPTFSQDKELLMYTGPLSKTCPCKTAHLPKVGISSDCKFNTSSNVLLGTAFWRHIFAAIRSSTEPLSVTDGELRKTRSRLSGSVSFSSLCRSWASGELPASQLREF